MAWSSGRVAQRSSARVGGRANARIGDIHAPTLAQPAPRWHWRWVGEACIAACAALAAMGGSPGQTRTLRLGTAVMRASWTYELAAAVSCSRGVAQGLKENERRSEACAGVGSGSGRVPKKKAARRSTHGTPRRRAGRR
eukprot:scaffold8111_cov110-Isochrysis_galbana.AAC.6